jgi:hypothetical protein
MDTSANRLDVSGFKTFKADDYANLPSLKSNSLLDEFSQDWSRLEMDDFMNDGGKYRTRRFGRLHYQPELDRLTPYTGGAAAFFQSSAVNKLNGGVQRIFAPVSTSSLNHPVLTDLIRFHFNQLPITDKSQAWNIFVHQIRITADGTTLGLPTPEGIHQDGHFYVAQILINRTNITGAVSNIYDKHRNVILDTTFTHPLDSILVDDKKVWHGVSPALPANHSCAGTRDMLLIDFNPA